MTVPQPLIVTGSNGRIGRLMRLHHQGIEDAGFLPTWTTRTGGEGASLWNMGQQDTPDLPICGFLLHLGAVLPIRSQGAELADNVAMAQAVLATDRNAHFAHVFFLSTVAVYAPKSTAIAETEPTNPQNDYGKAKVEAEQVLMGGLGERLTVLRLGNLAGADALLGSGGPVALDPVEGGGGPRRSYIGPAALVRVLTALMTLKASGKVLPPVINLALPGVVDMADLLRASGREWRFGQPRPEAVAHVEVDVTLLQELVTLPKAAAVDIVADLNTLQGRWP